MAGYSLAVQFKEYSGYEYYTYDDTSKPPDYTSGKFTELYKFIPKKSSARAIKNKFIYVFQKTSGGSAYINREMKADDQGKMEIYDINNWERETDRQVKSRNHERIYFDENSIKNGSKYYFCISQIQWSKERIRTIVNQLSAGYCKRLTPLPIHKDYLSGYTDEQKSAVEYSDDYLATVYLIDYMEYVYKASKSGDNISYSSPSLIYKFYTKKENYNTWLTKADDSENNHNRAELKAVNDAIWTLCNIGTKYWDLTRMSYMADIANRILNFTRNPLHAMGIVEQWKKFRKHSPYVHELKDLEERKYRNISAPTEYHKWTNAEAWLVNYKKIEREKADAWQDVGEIIVKWMAQKEFIAMQHDYLYSNNEIDIEEIKDITGNILMNIVDSNEGKKYIDSIVANTKNDLDRLKEVYKEKIDSIYAKNTEDISRDEQLSLLGLVESEKKETNFLATSFFVLRKLEIGTIKMLGGLAPLLPDRKLSFSYFFRYSHIEEVLSIIEETVKVNTIETVLDNFKDGRYKKTGFVSVKKDAFESGYYKREYGDVDTWKTKVKERLTNSLGNRNIDAEVDFELKHLDDGEYYVAVAKKVVPRTEVRNTTTRRMRRIDIEVDIKGVLEQDNNLKCFLKQDFLNDIVVGVEVLNVLFAFAELFNNSSEFEMEMDALNLTSAILDISATLSERLAGKVVSKAYKKVFTATSAVLGIISGGIEAYISWRYAQECAKGGDTEAEKAYILAACGGVTVAIGTLVAWAAAAGSVTAGVGAALVLVGVVMQIVGSVIAAVVTDDIYEKWIKHCYWGVRAGFDDSEIPDYSPLPFKDWNGNLKLQLMSYYYMLFDYKLAINYYIDNQDKPYGGVWISLQLFPNVVNMHSIFYVTLKLKYKENNVPKEKVLSDNKVIVFQDSDNADDVLEANIKKTDSGSIERVEVSWVDPRYYDFLSVSKDEALGLFRYRDDSLLEIMRADCEIFAEVSLDLYGNNTFLIPINHTKVIEQKLDLIDGWDLAWSKQRALKGKTINYSLSNDKDKYQTEEFKKEDFIILEKL